jgi:hypothetical protein
LTYQCWMRSTYLDHAAIKYKNRILRFLLLLDAPLGAVGIWRQPRFCCWNRETMMGSITPLLLVRRVLIVYVSGHLWTHWDRNTGIITTFLHDCPFCRLSLLVITVIGRLNGPLELLLVSHSSTSIHNVFIRSPTPSKIKWFQCLCSSPRKSDQD